MHIKFEKHQPSRNTEFLKSKNLEFGRLSLLCLQDSEIGYVSDSWKCGSEVMEREPQRKLTSSPNVIKGQSAGCSEVMRREEDRVGGP